MKVVKAYRFALDPRSDQVVAFLSHCGGRRFAYNHMLALVKANLDQREAERSYGIAGPELTPYLDWSAYGLRRTWNARKDSAAPWWKENSKEAYSSGCADLAAALKNWRGSMQRERAGRPMGFPRFKSRRSRLSCSFTTGAIRVEDDRRHITLPRIGTIRTCENTAKLHRHLRRGTGRILSAILSRRGDRWFVSFTCEIEHRERAPERPTAVVGVDLGIKHLAVLSTGEFIPNPQHLDKALTRLRKAGRQLARRRGPAPGSAPSARWLRARAGLNKAHARIAQQRSDALHKLTTNLARTYGTIVIEDLNVAGMVTNHRLARRISDAGWGELRRQITYKSAWNGGSTVVANRWLPTSKTCSNCGTAKAKLSLSERVFRCQHCGMVLDRDLNAARNLANRVRTAVDLELPGDAKTARQKPHKTSPAGSGTAAGRRAARARQAEEAQVSVRSEV
ncbi:IS607 family element RNA-guided endonuclease TnpB [Glycomyces artemisiae]|uniref:Putative transposase n=1 Tax=Glycomyces artemisiae TaxID=1076443 RepID=A0A2T0USK8_9ACTN|nr:IS607 family element RNA-guided endonuclease TnpB [Glycomyces artemisiae]PRY60884.1 putative transposase [Glycomyces artemisiae]